jgi:2-polyprenyl-3-methyl-5-hydroxy-6-metoxy-1,4-benzoquinol methylase
METVSCVLCGSNQCAPLYEVADYWLENLQTHVQLVRCEQCGLVYQNPRPGIQQMSAFYPPEYEVFQSGNRQQQGLGYRYGMRRRSAFITRYQQSGKLLDVGCASGLFLRWMEQAGDWQVYGVEPSDHAAQSARQQGLQVITGTIEDARYPAAFFDVITLWDVVEHLHDPVAALLEAQRVLKPGGLLVMRLPNLDSIDARLFGKYWAGLDAPRHLYVFGIQNLNDLLQKTGFQAVEMNSQVGGYLNFVKSVRFSLVGKGAGRFAKNFFIGMLSSIPARLCLAPFFTLKDMHLRGSEVVVVARRVYRSG